MQNSPQEITRTPDINPEELKRLLGMNKDELYKQGEYWRSYLPDTINLDHKKLILDHISLIEEILSYR